jgi:diguanylate cyclase (GGDEF)-like protein
MLNVTTCEPTISGSLTKLPGGSEKPQVASLVNIYPPNAHGGLIYLPQSRFVIGRESKADLWLDDPSISRVHAVIEPTAEGCLLTDAGSTNGTYVNDERITSSILQPGDQVRFGNHIFKVLGANDIETQFFETVYTRMVRDGLTGAHNKRYLLDALEREVKRTLRHRRPLSIAILDLDHFKNINDTYGHLIGDEVLKEASRRLMGIVRQDDIFARYGGEEFIAVFSETNRDQALIVAEFFRHAIAGTSFLTSAGQLKVTVSIGIASATGSEPITPNSLIGAADERLYQAKRAGRNRVEG